MGEAGSGELSAAEATERLDALLAVPVLLVPSIRLVADAAEIALATGLTGYDSMYVALSRTRGVPLVTADLELRTRAREALGENRLVVSPDELLT